MANPTNLQELADNLALHARNAEQRAVDNIGTSAASYHTGYREALLDTRATVLSMIAADRA